MTVLVVQLQALPSKAQQRNPKVQLVPLPLVDLVPFLGAHALTESEPRDLGSSRRLFLDRYMLDELSTCQDPAEGLRLVPTETKGSEKGAVALDLKKSTSMMVKEQGKCRSASFSCALCTLPKILAVPTPRAIPANLVSKRRIKLKDRMS